MKTFVYSAKTSQGKIVRSSVQADNPKAVVEALRNEGYFIVSIRERIQAPNPFVLFERLFKVGLKELTIYSRQFSLLLNAGLTISEALDTIEEQTQNGSFKEVLHKVKIDIQGGETLTNAMRRHPRAFSEFYCSMIHSGEIGGALDAILERVALFYEKELELRNKIQSALVYPVIVTVISIGIALFMLVYIVPQFAAFYSEFSEGTAKLPALTQKMMDISGWLISKELTFGKGGPSLKLPLPNIVTLLVFLTIFLIAFYKFRGTKLGKRIIDPIVLWIPIFGPLARKVAITRFTRTFATLSQSGVPILEALEVAKNTSSNNVIMRALEYTRERIREGESLHAPMRRTKVFPPLVTNLISVGEEAGNLEEILYKLSDYYDQEIDATVGAMASLIEPLMIIMIGAMVGTIVVALYLPIFNLVNVIQ